MRALAVVAVVACSGAPQPNPPSGATNQVTPTPRDTPAPALAYRATRFDRNDVGTWQITGLPAVARGGELAVVALIDGDGGRGNPNLKLEVRDRSDKVIQTIAVMTPDEADALTTPERDAKPELQRRIEAANRELAQLHGVHDLIEMHRLDVQKAPAGTPFGEHLAIGDGLDIDFLGDHLHVFVHNGNRPFVNLDTVRWRHAVSSPACAGVNVPYLGSVSHVNRINLLVVEVRFVGNDTCWEPPAQNHIVAW
jgi:hypothetical protein